LKEPSKYMQLCQTWLCRHRRLGFRQKICFISIFAYGQTNSAEESSRKSYFKLRNKNGLWGTVKTSSPSSLWERPWLLGLSKH